MAEGEDESVLFPERVGDRLRAARTAAAMDLTDVATKTRIPLRHLTAIESGDYASLPSSTYAIGFVKAFARAVGANEAELANALRVELGQRPREDRYEPSFIDDTPGGPVPTRTLAITAAVIGLLLVAGYMFWFGPYAADRVAADAVEPVVEAPQTSPQPGNSVAPAPAPPPAASGEVVLTAKEPVWIRVYDANDKVLFVKEMQSGERYTVPADANKPMIRTGRADLIAVSVGGQEVAPLGPAERTIKDVELTAQALSARTPPSPSVDTSSNSAASATTRP